MPKLNKNFELEESIEKQHKTTSLSTDRTMWLRVIDEVRNAIGAHDGYISIPKLTVTDLVY